MFRTIVGILLFSSVAIADLPVAKDAHGLAQSARDKRQEVACKQAIIDSQKQVEEAVAAGNFYTRLDYDVDTCPIVQQILNKYGYKTTISDGIYFHHSLDVSW